MTGDFTQMPSHDKAAEQCALGGMLLSREAIADVQAIIAPGDHFIPAHQMVHEVIACLAEAGSPADVITVAAELARRGEISKMGGAPYLHTLIASVPSAANAAWYARIVREHAVRRRMTEAGTRIVQLAQSGEGDAGEVAARAREELETAMATLAATDGLRSMRELVYGVLDDTKQDAERGLPLPWRDLMDALTGLVPGQLIYVAARPGTGKSIVGAQVAAYAAIVLGLPALLVSMEMRAEEITLRLISAQARVPLTSLLNRDVSEDDWDRIARAAEPVASSPLVIDDTPKRSLGDIRARLQGMARTGAARILVIDYLGLLQPPAGAENRQQAVAELSRGLKLIAGEFGIPVVALAQLNRGPEHRPDKRPAMSDLRDSGAQEQDADVVILLYREDAYNPESPRAGEIDMIVAKNRTGPQCTVTATFQGHYGRVMDMAPLDAVPAEWRPSSVLDGAA